MDRLTEESREEESLNPSNRVFCFRLRKGDRLKKLDSLLRLLSFWLKVFVFLFISLLSLSVSFFFSLSPSLSVCFCLFTSVGTEETDLSLILSFTKWKFSTPLFFFQSKFFARQDDLFILLLITLKSYKVHIPQFISSSTLVFGSSVCRN